MNPDPLFAPQHVWATMSLSQQVLVNYEYTYTARDGRNVSIKPNEHYILVNKTNEEWWHVQKDAADKPFYIPAKYVTELPPETSQTPLDPPEEFSGYESLQFGSQTADPAEVTLRVPDSIKRDTEKDGHRISTFIIPKEFFELKGLDPDPIKTEAEAGPPVSSNTSSPTNGETAFIILPPPVYTVNTTQSTETDTRSVDDPKDSVGRPRVDSSTIDEDIQMLNRAGWSEVLDVMGKEKNVYESLDTVREPESPKDEADMTVNTTPVTPDAPMVEDDTAVYVNIPRKRQTTINNSSPIASLLQDFPEPPENFLLDSAGWQVHTDDQSGQEFYYQPSTGRSTWENPLSSRSMESPVGTEGGRSPPSFPQSPACSPVAPAPRRWSSDWEKVLDESTGRHYFFNTVSGQSSWDPPEDVDSPGRLMFLDDCPYSASPGQYGVGNGASGEQDTVGSNWRHSAGYPDDKNHSSYIQNTSDSEASSSPDTPHNVSNLEKAGILNKTKVSENGKKVRKNWGHSWTVLHGGKLTFHKDPKSTPAGASSKTNQILPEFTVDLKGATINRAPKDKSSKKNVLELKTRTGAEYLIQYDTDSIIQDWHKVILDTIHQLNGDQHHSEEEDEVIDKSPTLDREERPFEKRTMSTATRQPSTSSTSEAEQKKVRTKLKKFLLKRPTLQSVKDKGYIRENVFGCHLHNLCSQEKTRVPSFVEKCIRAVEKRGLEIDGLYRVSGNLAVIQKLRFKADHEDLDLEEGNWDIHVITGALKLFFRELQEPLFPYNLFNEFICAIKTPDYYSKISHMRNLVRSLPPPNHDTMEALFSHLRRVIQHGNENRMTVQNVAIVFGPTLLKPEEETASIATYMVFQNQIVEFLLSEFESIFHM
ncbi:rho GTPase-activating protein 27 isoform X5 [Danio rerio]|uniref:Rho GTPase-activating protein 27 isoform X5 n=2 Tax=Danio rerio TaxID=7955 RepID=A0AC58GWT1_DANRE